MAVGVNDHEAPAILLGLVLSQQQFHDHGDARPAVVFEFQSGGSSRFLKEIHRRSALIWRGDFGLGINYREIGFPPTAE
jgi:hypothetical protein